jgi:TetR/AcrR family transcriptional repressor of lmrAB and yxaGH operons
LNQIIKESGAPRGSLYYYFPAGKEELAAEAVLQKGERMGRHIKSSLVAYDDAIEAIYRFIVAVIPHFQQMECASGAPLAAVALETSASNERLRQACQQAYAMMLQPIEQKLLGHGYPAEQASQLASTILGLLEGAMILSRVKQDPEPIRHAAESIKTLLESIQSTNT